MKCCLWLAGLLAALFSVRAQSGNPSVLVRQILETQCQACHSSASRQAGLDVTSREKLLRGGDRGPAVVPGKPEESLLYLYVRHDRQPGMPFGGKKLAEEQIAAIAEWIRSGASFEEPLKSAASKPVAMDH
jgi:mono/diheme cytochrome c family protein